MCAKNTMEDFEALLKESFEIDTPEEGTVVKGKVIAIEAGQAIIDVGYKMEGRVDLKEFADLSGGIDVAASQPRAACPVGRSLRRECFFSCAQRCRVVGSGPNRGCCCSTRKSLTP